MGKTTKATATANRPPARGRAGANGFTLIELMIVLVIMSIFAAFAGPRVASGLIGLNIKTAAKRVGSALRYARSKAVNTGCQYNVVFDGIDRRVLVLQSKPAASWGVADNASALAELAAAGLDEDVDLDPDAVTGRPQQEKKIYELPKGVFFEKVVIADVDSEDAGDEMLMLLAFYPNGTTRGAEVTIADEAERRFFINVAALTGAVSVQEEVEDD